MPSGDSFASSITSSLFLAILVLGSLSRGLAEDPYVYFDWTVSYLSSSPLGVKQQVFLASRSLAFDFCSVLLLVEA